MLWNIFMLGFLKKKKYFHVRQNLSELHIRNKAFWSLAEEPIGSREQSGVCQNISK